MDLSNYYYLLNVDKTATFKDIVNSYRNLSRLAKKYNIIKSYYPHIQMAYLVLSNPKSRKQYDEQLRAVQNLNNRIQYDNQFQDVQNINNNELYTDSIEECEYVEYTNDNNESEELKEINYNIHKEMEADKIEELRDKELKIMYDEI